MSLAPRQPSLQRRLLLASLVLTIAALLTAAVAIGFILHRFVRGQIDGRLDDRIVALSQDLAPGRGLEAAREGDALPFGRPRSGWYWQVSRGGETLRSGSLQGRDLALPEHPGRSPGRIGPADGEGPWGEPLVLRVLVLPGEPQTLIVASAPAAALRGPVVEALRTLALCLGILGVLLIGGAWVQVRLGLKPLGRLRADLAAVRAGRATRLRADQPAEIAPLAVEMNALIDQNAAALETARAHVANLAHGLKTPLATLSLALRRRDEADDELTRLVAVMERRVRHHLRRARSAAAAGPSLSRVPLGPRVADLREVLIRLFYEKAIEIAIDIPAGLVVACDAQDVDEMLGNIMENACRWCEAKVQVSGGADGGAVRIAVSDDGPGLDTAQIAEVLQRGRRLDESAPGHGFGLPIAAELAALYGGGLGLDRATLGGLRATLMLPA